MTSPACERCQRAKSPDDGSSSSLMRSPLHRLIRPRPVPTETDLEDDGGSLTLRAVLEEAQNRGLIGHGSLDRHIDHALLLLPVLPSEGHIVDLGSGGGLPGLPLLATRQELRWVFIDSLQRRVRWLEEAIAMLDAEDRAVVRQERAELSGRSE